ncbi:MAG: hypothetical protein IPK13_00785 [Deltaproteobacteria bacterium]|nr:hypothetical protein [Deltaproteobacteria bacterium]
MRCRASAPCKPPRESGCAWTCESGCAWTCESGCAWTCESGCAWTCESGCAWMRASLRGSRCLLPQVSCLASLSCLSGLLRIRAGEHSAADLRMGAVAGSLERIGQWPDIHGERELGPDG